MRLRTHLKPKTLASPATDKDERLSIMKSEPEKVITSLAHNGKLPAKAIFHRGGDVSARDDKGRWHRHLATVPPSIIMKLDRPTRARLWIRNFSVERAWAEANA